MHYISMQNVEAECDVGRALTDQRVHFIAHSSQLSILEHFVQHFKSFPTHPHTINLSLFLFLLHSRDITPKGQVIIALKQMRYDRCQAVVMSDGCLRAKVRPPAEETLVFMLESMKHTPTPNCSPTSALRWRAVHSGMTCAINGVILSDNRKLIRCSQVNPVKQTVIKGDS